MIWGKTGSHRVFKHARFASFFRLDKIAVEHRHSISCFCVVDLLNILSFLHSLLDLSECPRKSLNPDSFNSIFPLGCFRSLFATRRRRRIHSCPLWCCCCRPAAAAAPAASGDVVVAAAAGQSCGGRAGRGGGGGDGSIIHCSRRDSKPRRPPRRRRRRTAARPRVGEAAAARRPRCLWGV